MPMTKDQATMLATLASACRPIGAKRWDAPGIVAALGKVNTLHLADVIHATIVAAEDATLDTPAAIGNTSSPIWGRYRELGKRPQPSGPIPAAERCSVCSHRESECRRRDMQIPAQDRHDFAPDFRDTAETAAEVAHLRTLIRATEGATEPTEGASA